MSETGWKFRFSKQGGECRLEYAIIYGGSASDAMGNITANAVGHIFVSGNTFSPPNTSSFYSQSMENAYFENQSTDPNDDSFTFLTRFIGGTGTIQWSTVIATHSDWTDHPTFPLIINDDGELYMAGEGQSLSGIEVQGGGYQLDVGSTDFDKGYILRFNTDLQIDWATEFGNGCNIYDMDITPQQDLVICGSMNVVGHSNFEPYASEGQWTSSFGGGIVDGFFAVFKPDNTLKWSSWFGGNGTNESIHGVSSVENSIFFCGDTNSDEDFPLQYPPNFFQYYDDINASSDGFVTQFKNGQLVWSTYFGGSSSDYLRDVHASTESEVYLTGTSKSQDLDLTEFEGFFFEEELNGGVENKYDSFVTCFQDKYLIWNTFLGGNHGGGTADESGFELALVQGSKLYVAGTAESNMDFPWWDFDGEESDVAYFDDFLQPIGSEDAWIARLDVDDISLSVDDYSPSTVLGIGVFPNPSSDVMHINFDFRLTDEVEIQIFDVQGKLITTESFNAVGNNLVSMSVEDLPVGIYAVEFVTKNIKGSAKFIKE